MKDDPSTLFQAFSEFLLIVAVAGLAASAYAVAKSNPAENKAVVQEKEQEKPTFPQAGKGHAAVVFLDAPAEDFVVDGKHISAGDFLHDAGGAQRVVLRLKGPQWREITALIRTRDLSLSIETDR